MGKFDIKYFEKSGLDDKVKSKYDFNFQFCREYEEKDAIETIRQALRSGLNYIDTAPYYGQGRSEKVIGKALEGVPREAYYIATKVARYEVPPKKQFDFSYEKTLESVDVSLKYLGLDYVDLIQVICTLHPHQQLEYEILLIKISNRIEKRLSNERKKIILRCESE